MTSFRTISATWRAAKFLLPLLPAAALAHSPFESSTRAIVMENALELALTVGMDGGKALLKDQPSEASLNRPVGPGFALSKDFAARLFEVSAGGASLVPDKVMVRTDGLEFNFVVAYPRPAAGAMTARAVYVDQLPSTLKSSFILTDENGNILATRSLKQGDSAFDMALPGTAVLAENPPKPELPKPELPKLKTFPDAAAHFDVQPATAPPPVKVAPRAGSNLIWLAVAGLIAAFGLMVVLFWKRKRTACVAAALLLAVAFAPNAHAQRQMEKLGRGVVALHSATSQAYIGWRLLATDPSDVGFNVYRSANGAAGVKLNSTVISNTTDYLDTTATFTVSNAWYVVPVIGGVEQTPSAAYGQPANSSVRQYIPIPLQTVTGGLSPPYDVKFCWFGDFDGDGEYDYLVDRLTTTATNKANQYLQAYKRDGTLLWQMDMGFNSTNTSNAYEPDAACISVGDKDNVTVYDLDGDNKAEVIVRTANGTIFADGSTLVAVDNTIQFLSILDGLTGVEKARATIPNLYYGDGPLNCHAGIIYWDGVHPSILFDGENRVGSGNFQRQSVTWDYRNGVLTQRWIRGDVPGENQSEGHQLRICDANHDGKDDLIQIASVVTDNVTNGVLLYDTELVHGDRYHVTDIDPDRPGLEMFSIQQNNATLLATALQDMSGGTLFKKWYSGSVTDVGRGITLDLVPNTRGCEMYSTQPGIFDAKGTQIYANNVWPPEALWWDADVLREFEDGAGSGAYNPVVNKFNPSTGNSDRIYTLYNEDGGTHQAYGGRAAVWGDLFGDWREEFMVVADDYNSVRIYTTKLAATNRIYCLMQNPMYRVQCTYKGYYQASYVDYYLGQGMPVPPVPPVSDAQLVWRGGASSTWDTSAVNWFTNNLWISNTTAVAYTSASSVLFDLTGSNNSAITLTGSLTPGAVTVHSPKNYTFDSTAGSLAGSMKLTKAGAGKLTLTGTNTYTGATLVSEGPFVVNGSLPNSPVTVRGGVWLDGRLGGTGIVGSAVSVHEGAGFSPGAGTNSPGTLTVSSNVTLAGRTLNDFDLSDNPSGATNDLLVVNGNLTLTGTNTFVIRKLNSSLPQGSVYPLINYSGTLSGNLNNLAVSGLPGVPLALTNPPGQIALLIKSYRSPATISWTGGSGGNAWDLLTTSNWLNGATKDQFAPNDTVRFDSIGTSNLTATLSGDLNAASVVVDSTANYTLAGSGGIIGSASLTKSNTGTLTISALNNSFTGKTTISGGTVVVSELDAVGYPSPLGNPPAGSTNIVLNDGATLRITGESYTDRGLTLNGGTNTVDVFNSADQVTVAGIIAGGGALQKLGSGTLALNVSNAFTGQTLIRAGNLAFGGDDANQYGLGPGPGGNGNTTITFSNASLTMYNNSGSYNHTYWNLAVPTGATGTFYADDRCYLHGTLTGGGTFNYYTYYVRAELDGNWSGFTGTINVRTDSDGGDFRINNSSGYANCAINLASLTYFYHISGSAVSIGELSGSQGSVLSGGSAWTIGAKNTDATFSGNISSGSITKTGTGTWTINGTNNAYTGTTTVSAGTLLVNASNAAASGNVTVGASGTLGGTGTIGGATTVNGKLAPGSNAIGTLNFSGNLTFGSGGTAVVEINKTSGTKDLADAVATLTYGGTLQVTNLSGTLTNGDSFKIFDAATYAGSFSTFNLPSLNSGLSWNTASLITNGTINVISTNALPPPPGAPTNLVATAASYSQINLTWADNSTNETSFLIERSTDNVNFNQIASVSAGVTNYSNTGLTASTLYYYRVRASNTGGNSAYSNTASATTLALPTGLIWRGDGSANLWDVGVSSNWNYGGTLAQFVNGASAIFDDSGSNNVAVSLSGLIAPDSVTVTASENYTFSGSGSLSNTMPLIKTGSGTLTISSAQLYSGGTFVGGGTFAITSNGDAGSGSITFSNGTTFLMSGSSVFEGAPISVASGATVTMNSGNLANGYNGSISSGDDETTFIIAGPVSMDGQNLKQFQGFTGMVQINSGAQLRFSKTSGVNNGGDFTSFMVNGTLNTRNGGSVACGSLSGGSMGFLSGGSSAAGTTAFTIGNLGVDSTFAGTIQDANSTGVTSLTKIGAGILTLAGSNTYSLTTTISAGTLQIGDGGGTGTLPTNSIVNNATLTFNRSDAISDSGVISGTGSVVQDGDGTVTFTRNHTYSGATLVNSGTLALTGSGSISNSSISIASGATLDVSGRTGGSMTLASEKTLSGNGSVNGSLILASGAKLTPGNSIGMLTFSNNLTLSAGSMTTIEISTPPLANDRVNVSGTMTLGGSLVVTNISAGVLAGGDSFQLFNAQVFFGSFTNVTLPALGQNLSWDTSDLNVNGAIQVSGINTNPPVFSGVARVGTNLILSGTNGTVGASYYVLTTTNISLPASQWTRAATNPFDSNGNFNFTNALQSAFPSEKYFMLQLP